MTKAMAGIFAVIPTAMTEQEDVDEAALRRHIRYLVDVGGVHVIVALGSTGEFASLTEPERKQVAEITIDEVGGKVPVVVGASAITTQECIMYSQHAEKAGANGILLVHPYYLTPCEREMDEHLKAIAGTTSLPIVIYNNTSSTGYDLLPPQLARLATIDNLSYIKETSGSSKRISEIIGLLGDSVTVLCGDDLLPVESLALGAKGWVSVSANVFPRECVELYELLAVEGDLVGARMLWYKLLPFTSLLENSGKFVQYIKAGCAIVGRPVGPPRKPFLWPTDEEMRTLKQVIATVPA